MRLPWPAVGAAALALVLGGAGLVRGAVPQSSAPAPAPADPIVVTGAFVRAPVPPTQLAAAYFTVHNLGGTADRLVGVQTGAGASAVIHADMPNGSMQAMSGGVPVPAHGTLVFSTGKGHIMIGKLFGPLRAGQNVNIELDFAAAGSLDVSAPVVAVGAPPPSPGGHS